MSDVRDMLAEAVTRLFADAVGPERIAEAERGAWLGDVWDAVEANGFTMPHLSEAAGGAGGTWREAFVIAAATGRHAVPLPIAETMLGAWLLAEAGLEVPAGPIAVAPDVAPRETLVSGELRHDARRVPWARHARTLVVLIDGAEPTLVSTSSFGIVREGWSLAREPRDDVRVEGRVECGPRKIDAATLRAAGALLRAAEMAGALEAILALSVRYANERVQFGKPIGRQQAIQQELARLAGMTAEAGMAAEVAAASAAQRGLLDAAFEIGCAKVVVGDAADAGPRIAHQVHGAIGFTYEHALHFFTRRLWAWRSEFGTAEEWGRKLGRAVVTSGADGLWPLVTSR